MAEQKDVVYIDVDEEITSIVSKVSSSKKSIVALVLPKRAAVLQSIVNMKLLKRASDQNDKQVVLITSEARLLPLAGAAKVFVAPNLTSKPYIPPAPTVSDTEGTDHTDVGDVEVDPKSTVGEASPDSKFASDEDALEIDNTAPKAGEDAAKQSPKGKSGKKKIPNFNSFRKKLILGGVIALLLVVGLVWALVIAPKAKVTLKTQSSDVAAQFDFVADTDASEFDQENKIIPAQVKEVEKNDSETVDTTGERNDGKKASGTVTLKNCSKAGGQVTLPAGTGVSSGDFTFLTDQAVSLPASIFTGPGDCITPTRDVSVTAQDAGDEYNLSSRQYSVAGKQGIGGVGSDMKGGTNKIVKIVSQKDIESAKERLSSKQNTVQDEIAAELDEEGFVAIPDTFETSSANYNPSPGLNSEADQVTVSVTTKYSMLGVKKDDLKKLIEDDVKDEKTGDQQALLDDGIGDAKFNISTAIGQLGESQLRINFASTVVLGPEINQDELKGTLAGMRKGPAEDLLKTRPGIIDPQVELSPFWVSSIPGNGAKVTFEIQQADGSAISDE